jgi:hypothetical protein
MITHFINWVKGLFSKKEEPITLEEIKEEIQEMPQHCSTHLRFKKSCPACLRMVAAI